MFQPANISTPDQIQKELDEIQAFLEAKYSSDNPAAVKDRMDDLASYMARSGKLKADAEYQYNGLLESSIMAALKKGYEEQLSPSTLNKYVESLAKDYKFLLTYADRVNRSCTHQLDAIRSVISTLRAELYSNFGR